MFVDLFSLQNYKCLNLSVEQNVFNIDKTQFKTGKSNITL